MDICNQSCSIGRPAVLRGENVNVGHYEQIFQPDCFYTRLVNRHHWLLPFYTTFNDLDLAWRSKGQRNAKPVGFILLHIFPINGMKLDIMLKQFTLNIPILLLSEIHETKEITSVLLIALEKKKKKKHLWRWHAFGRLWTGFFQTWHDHGYYQTLHFHAILSDSELHSKSQECEKAKMSATLISQSFQLIWMGFRSPLRLFSLINLMFIFLIQSIFKELTPSYVISFTKNNVGLFSDICDPMYLAESWCGGWDYSTLHFETSLDDLDLRSRSQLYKKSQTSVPIFSQISQWTWMKFSMLPQPVPLLKLMLNVFRTIDIQRGPE